MLMKSDQVPSAANGMPLAGARTGDRIVTQENTGEPVLVRLDDVSKTYTQGKVEVRAVREVSLAVTQGELLAICGPSGSGKSTLLNMIGLLDDPSSGQITMLDRTLASLDSNARADLRNAAIGFIFQSFNLIPVLSALENVLLPLNLRGKMTATDRQRGLELLEAVGLADRLHAYPDRMSGGQRQRVAIARALVTQPRLVIADEPTANLDTDTSLAVMDLITELCEKQKVTFVFSTHDERILKHMTRIVHLHDGRIQAAEN